MVKPNRSDLGVLKDLIEAEKIVPFIVGGLVQKGVEGAYSLENQTYNLSEVPTAIRQLEQRQVWGKIAISIVGRYT